MSVTIDVNKMAEEIAKIENIDLDIVYRVLCAEERYLEKYGLIEEFNS